MILDLYIGLCCQVKDTVLKFRVVECGQKPDNEVLPEAKEEENVEDVTPSPVLVDDIYPAPTVFAFNSFMDDKEATKIDDAMKSIA